MKVVSSRHTSGQLTGCIAVLVVLTGGAGSISSASGSGQSERGGERVFQQACFACHGTGLNGAPVVGDEYAWQPRREKGVSVLVANTLNGLNNMPPRGACADCSDTEIEAAVHYLIGN